MSILPLVPHVREYNKDKPPAAEVMDEYELKEHDFKKIVEIRTMILKLHAPYDVELMMHALSKRVYLRCTDKPTPPRKSISLPEIKNGAMKA